MPKRIIVIKPILDILQLLFPVFLGALIIPVHPALLVRALLFLRKKIMLVSANL